MHECLHLCPGQLQKQRKKLKAQLEEAKREEARLEEDAPVREFHAGAKPEGIFSSFDATID